MIEFGDMKDVPCIPLFPGLLANTAIYGSAWWLLLFTPGAVKRWRRRRKGCCIKCGYDLQGSPEVRDHKSEVSVVCPECGAQR